MRYVRGARLHRPGQGQWLVETGLRLRVEAPAAITLTQSSRFDDADTFYAAALRHRLSQASRFDDADTFYAAALRHRLSQASRFDDADTFYAAFITNTGAVALDGAGVYFRRRRRTH